ncbi:hypothetical protein [Singulisphaera sp. PoT]|uniref:hypothetical protein n=1 Tax=Singulisphaera sp. PoT TaxID=3411797 RepID=UPI003BF50C14
MRRIPSSRNRLASTLVAAGLSALLAQGVCRDVLGQVPGPEIFHKQPTTPMEQWDAVDYLVRTGQAPQAVPYLKAFLSGPVDDATLLHVRDRFGAGSVLRLADYPETREYALPLTKKLTEAMQRNARRPERIQRYVAALTQSREEQDYAIEQLREAGPYAVPYLVQELGRPNQTSTDRFLLVHNMGKLDRSAVPALLAALDSQDSRLVHDVAEALGNIRDRRAIPDLTYLGASGKRGESTQEAARRALARLTGHAFDAQPKSPVRVLTDAARQYHLHDLDFPGDSALVWIWNPASGLPEPKLLTKSEAEGYFGLRLARKALQLDPTDVPAQVILVSLAVDKGVERAGYTAYPATDPAKSYPLALSAGPDILGKVLDGAVADRKYDLAAAAATALGQVTDRDVLASSPKPHPLVTALSAPDRRVQLAAARSLIQLEPRRPFAGSSQLVPTLARFVMAQGAPRAIIVDGNSTRGNLLGSHAKALGYEPVLARTGDAGFRAAVESADVELILIDCHLIDGSWRVRDTLSNLKADARTASIPTYVVGPRTVGIAISSMLANFPDVKFLVTPGNPDLLKQQIGDRPPALTDAERETYARDASVLLAHLASRPGNPFESDLAAVEPALSVALNTPPTSLAASWALGDVPDAKAQRGLADALLDPSKPMSLRLSIGSQLAKSLQRFGPLVAADQEEKLVAALDREADPVLRNVLASVVGALRPKAGLNGIRLRQYEAPTTSAAPAQPTPNPAPDAVPSPPTPEPEPKEGAAEAETPPADAKP